MALLSWHINHPAEPLLGSAQSIPESLKAPAGSRQEPSGCQRMHVDVSAAQHLSGKSPFVEGEGKGLTLNTLKWIISSIG